MKIITNSNEKAFLPLHTAVIRDNLPYLAALIKILSAAVNPARMEEQYEAVSNDAVVFL